MEQAPKSRSPQETPGVLGDVLYGGSSRPLVAEADWVSLVRSVAAGSHPALHALFERSNRIVYTLAVRIVDNAETAEEVTLDVFHDVWRRAAAYDPVNGTVVGWIMNQARSRAIDRLRFEHRKKRVDPGMDESDDAQDSVDPRLLLELKQQSAAIRSALSTLTPHEREAIECAFFAGLTHAEAAERLNEPLGTVKTRIRSGLQKLRRRLETP